MRLEDLEKDEIIPPKAPKVSKTDKMSIRDGSGNQPPESGGPGGLFGGYDSDDYPERDGEKWNDPLADEFARQQSPSDASLLKEWTGSSFQFNGPTREGKTTPKIEQLVKIIDFFEVPDNAKMFRVETSGMLRKAAKKGIFFKEGDIVKLEDFTSASATKKAVNETRDFFEKRSGKKMNVEIELFVPKGAKAIPLSQASKDLKHEYQKEWLFQKDTEVQVLENHIQNGRVYLKLLILNR